MTIYIFSQLVLNWYHMHGRKNLPWQKNKTLYTVWISEIMLQQTTVKYVIPYFKRFILKFPNIYSLNNSTLDEILYLWSGLGYYNRARNIYKTAQIIQKEFKGNFPNQFSDIIKLPGIGRSTAGAILSLTLNFHYSILDSNVKRILIRYYGFVNILKNHIFEKKLWKIIELITPIHNTGKFNQAMMDIGAMICTYIQPKCNVCPLHTKCIARIKKQWNLYTLSKQHKKIIEKQSWFIIIQCNNYFWMKKNTTINIWRNLFCFPRFDTEIIALNWLKENKINIQKYKKMTSFSHRFSHFILHIYPIVIQLSCTTQLYEQPEHSLWYNVDKPQHIGLPQPVQKILKTFKIKNIKKKECSNL